MKVRSRTHHHLELALFVAMAVLCMYFARLSLANEPQASPTSDAAATVTSESGDDDLDMDLDMDDMDEELMVPPDPVTDAQPVDPQPATDALKPGLAVTYFYKKYYELLELLEEEEEGVPGEPLTQIDHVSETAMVLTAEQSILVGARIRGLIHLTEVGSYSFRVNSNDGVRLTIGDEILWVDPFVHYDRMSPPLELVVENPGWYSLAVDYYQKKGSAALQLFWTPPGSSESIVPAEALARQEG